MNPLLILKRHFGYESFRLNQEAIINAVLRKKDTFVLMPTGGGKSLCYQIPALLFDGLTLVISPLIALMKDQVDALRLNGIEAAYLNSTQSYQEQESIIARAKNNTLKLLYLAPEKLLNGDKKSPFLETLTKLNVSLIAIDEAHCISHWGHDFRTEYLALSELKRSLPHAPIIALTATADRITQKDIVEQLALKDPEIFVSSFNRANIRYTVEQKRDSFDKLLTFLETRKNESGIVYCLSRKSTEALAEDLTREGYDALPYHAGLEREIRAKHQELFQKDMVKIMVATIAFGMGIDKSNVRYVVHMDLPKNVESYYQETGRAGRDGLESEALLFYSAGDVIKLKKFAMIENNPHQTKIALKKLDEMARFGELRTCRRKYLLNYFNEIAPLYCGNCDICLTSYEMVDGTSQARKVFETVKAVHEKFGIGYIIDLLRGSSSGRIEGDHRALPVFGSGTELPKEEWHTIIQDLIARDFLVKRPGIYPVLLLTEKANRVLEGKEAVTLSKPREKIAAPEPHRTGPEIPYEKELLDQLKDLRRQLATKENVPAYVVLSDATLTELAAYLPHTHEEFSLISGFGEMKLEKYGSQFRSLVAAYCVQYGLQSRIHLKPPKRKRVERPDRDNETKQRTLELFLQGNTPEHIATLRKLSTVTIQNHLAFYVREGKINIEQVMDIDKISPVQETLANLGAKALAPVKESLGENYSYAEIKYVIAHLERSQAEEPFWSYVSDVEMSYAMEPELV